MIHMTKEKQTAQLTIALKDESGNNVAKATIDSGKVKLFNLDDGDNTVINTRDGASGGKADCFSGGAGQNGFTFVDGSFTWVMETGDNPILDATKHTERHGVEISLTYDTDKILRIVQEIMVQNMQSVS